MAGSASTPTLLRCYQGLIHSCSHCSGTRSARHDGTSHRTCSRRGTWAPWPVGVPTRCPSGERLTISQMSWLPGSRRLWRARRRPCRRRRRLGVRAGREAPPRTGPARQRCEQQRSGQDGAGDRDHQGGSRGIQKASSPMWSRGVELLDPDDSRAHLISSSRQPSCDANDHESSPRDRRPRACRPCFPVPVFEGLHRGRGLTPDATMGRMPAGSTRRGELR